MGREENVPQEDEKKEAQPKTEEAVEKKEESTGLIDKAAEQADRLEAANKKQEELLDRQEAMAAKQALGGKADAGSSEKQEEDPVEYAKKLQNGELHTDDFLDTKKNG